MGRREEAAGLLRRGNPPSKIARTMGVTCQTVMGYLNQKVGERELWRYEVLLSMDRADRDLIDQLWERLPAEAGKKRKVEKNQIDLFDEIWKMCHNLGLSLAEYLLLREGAFADMYELIRRLERRLHRDIRAVLESEYGEQNWWREGIPLKVRKELQCLLEEDAEPASTPYNYTTIIHLREICDADWTVVSKVLPHEFAADKKGFLRSLTRLNQVRRSVMHPVRGIPLRDEDFRFVCSFSDSVLRAPKREATRAADPGPTPQARAQPAQPGS